MIISLTPSLQELATGIHYHVTRPALACLKKMLPRFTRLATGNTSRFTIIQTPTTFIPYTMTKSSYIWNTAENSTIYNRLTFGVFFSELSQNFKLIRSGEETFKMRF